MQKLLALLALIVACNTTLDYGYYTETFDEEAIIAFFALADEAINTQDYPTYSGLFGPNYASIDVQTGQRGRLDRSEYLKLVKEIFESARELRMTTLVVDIEMTEPGAQALVTTQEEEYRKMGAETMHYTSLNKVVVGYEDGWIFFARAERTASRKIQD